MSLLNVPVRLGILLTYFLAPLAFADQDMQTAGAGNERSGLRTWTSQRGAKVVARFVRLEGDTVVLAKEDGSTFSIGRRHLSADDQAILPAAPAPKPDVLSRRSEDRLPVFTTGEGKGYHSVFHSPLYDALVDDRLLVLVYPKDNKGKRVGKPVRFGSLQMTYHNKDERKERGRKIIKFNAPPKPSLNPSSISVTAQVEDGVTFSYTITFTQNSIKLEGKCEDPRSVVWPTLLTMSSKIQQTHDIPNQMPLAERKKLLQGYRVSYTSSAGKTKTVAFFESVDLKGQIKQAKVVGPWGPRILTVEGKLKPHRVFSIRNYKGFPPWRGFRLIRYASAGYTGEVLLSLE